MAQQQASTVRRRKARSAFLGVTSDGVKIPRPVRGSRNLSDSQVRQIVDGMLELLRERGDLPRPDADTQG